MMLQVSLIELNAFAKTFWDLTKDTKIFAFHGTMGAGKTTTIAALCRSKGVSDAIASPTFSIINEYRFVENDTAKKMFHMDLFRLKDDEEVMQAGVEDCINSSEICLVEWPEKAPFLFDQDTVHVLIQPVNETVRQIEILTAAEWTNHTIAEQL
jgi:tRNA threonylcarbamoyladenosine biosynthesis protein TsaE